MHKNSRTRIGDNERGVRLVLQQAHLNSDVWRQEVPHRRCRLRRGQTQAAVPRCDREFLSGTPAVLREADEPFLRYYKDFEQFWLEDRKVIKTADQRWTHVKPGKEVWVSRRAYGDKGIYVSIECECDWEREHGLQLVLENGLTVNKLGTYHGHLTNADAFGDPSPASAIYLSLRMLASRRQRVWKRAESVFCGRCDRVWALSWVNGSVRAAFGYTVIELEPSLIIRLSRRVGWWRC